MKAKRILSLLLSLVTVLCLTVAPALANDTETVRVYLNVTQYGKIVKDKSDNAMALAAVELTDKETYTLDDVFKALHDTYYDGGSSSGYASAYSQYGLYVTKFWGDESGNFGYQVNGGTQTVMGLSYVVENGDYIDVAIFKSTFPNTESYTKFDKYEVDAYTDEEIELTLSRASYDNNWNTVFSACENAFVTINENETEYVTDNDGKVTLSFDTAGKYIISASKNKTADEKVVPDITAPICVVEVKECPDSCITVPSDAVLFVGTKGKKHFVNFTEIESVYSKSDGENTKYYFELTDKTTYNFRVSGDEYITYGGIFKKTADFSMTVTDEQLKPAGKTKRTVDRDTSSNGGCNVADIYLNINPKGYLKLSKNDTFQIVSLRNWEAVNNTSSNYFIEPDYHYEVTDENGNATDVAEIDENGLLTAKKSGTAIVLVTYDAMTLNYGSADNFYGAIYPENTGVFVISVDSEESQIETGITINEGKNIISMKLSGDNMDSEHDCIYYLGEQGEYTFTPITKDVKVYASNPTVDTKTTYKGFTEIPANDDNSFSVPLLTGRNIVKVEKDGNAEYQIITAKKVNVTINHEEAIHRGDTVNIVFDTLYHPANKLAGVYNMHAVAVYNDVSGYDGKVIGATSSQYNLANNSSAQTVSNVLKEKNSWNLITYDKDTDLIIPEDYAYDTFTLSQGSIYVSGFGDSYGNHRAITYENGSGANLNADAKLGYLGKLPDIKIPVIATSSALSSIELNTDNVKISYFNGDKFDTTGLIVTAIYEDQTTQIATNYSVSPQTLTTDTDNVTVTYRGITAEIPVTVTNPKVSSIEITKPPAKISYLEGETVSPSGMIVNAVYENGIKEETTDYSYSPNRELQTTDTEMIITYTGENTIGTIAPVSQAITVKEKAPSEGTVTPSDKISVYFTLLGDKKHGEPSGDIDTHTKKKGNLEPWIKNLRITLDKGSYVIDAVEKALNLKGIPYTNENGYISNIKGLSEFDNGNLSGWMLTLNGYYPTKSINEQKLSNGDVIVFHYTDDYTSENTGYAGSTSSSKSNKPKAEKEPQMQTEQKAVFTDNTYPDVKMSDWHYEAVKYAYENSLMQGTDNGFEPDKKMTRAMLVTVLYRMANPQKVESNHTFTDVSQDQWYTDAVSWAASNKIVRGISNTEFAPDSDVSREQMALIIYRFAQIQGYDMSNKVDISGFTDMNDISDWALEAIKWANKSSLINGFSKTTLSPKSSATRAQVAAILMRFCKITAK